MSLTLKKTEVVNKRISSYDQYIGRGSLFGNPYTHLKTETKAQFRCETREESIEKFKDYFLQRVGEDSNFKNEVLKLRGKILGCFCKPQTCHGDIIVDYLDSQIKEEKPKKTNSMQNYLNSVVRIAIVGSRDFNDFQTMKREVVDFILKHNLDKGGVKEIMIVSGGAGGADSLAENLAKSMSWDRMIFPAKWKKDGVQNMKAGFERNSTIVDNCDALIAFRVNKSTGTTDSIEKAKARKIKVRVVDL